MIGSAKTIAISFILTITMLLTMAPLTQPAFAADSAQGAADSAQGAADSAQGAADSAQGAGEAESTIPSGMVQMPETRELPLTEGEMTKIVFGTKKDQENHYYFKVEPAKTGYISLTGEDVRGYVDLCDSAKNVISQEDKSESSYFSASSRYAYQKTVSFGVKRGETYFIRIKFHSWKWDRDELFYHGSLKWTNTAIRNIKFGKKKKTAVSLKRASGKSGVIKAGDNKAQWYKIKTKRKKVKITFSAKNNCGTLYAKVYYKKGGKWFTAKMTALRSAKKFKKTCTIRKRSSKKVTYYVKVYPKYKASGAYKLVWE